MADIRQDLEAFPDPSADLPGFYAPGDLGADLGGSLDADPGADPGADLGAELERAEQRLRYAREHPIFGLHPEGLGPTLGQDLGQPNLGHDLDWDES